MCIKRLLTYLLRAVVVTAVHCRWWMMTQCTMTVEQSATSSHLSSHARSFMSCITVPIFNSFVLSSS